jgi:hypothetical protein
MRVTSSAARFSGIVGCVLIAGCPTPAQEGGLARIDTEGFARRLELVCSSGHSDPSCQAATDASDIADRSDGGEDAPTRAESGAESRDPDRH